MKIKEVMKLARERGMLYLGQNGLDKYMGDGAALYAACGNYDTETLFILTDTTEKQKEKLRVTYMDNELSFMADIDGTEEEITRMGFSINYGGDTFSIFETEQGAVFVNKKYFKPLADDLDMEFRLRRIGDTKMVIVHYGFVTAAAICPFELLNLGFADRIARLDALCAAAQRNGLFCEEADGK